MPRRMQDVGGGRDDFSAPILFLRIAFFYDGAAGFVYVKGGGSRRLRRVACPAKKNPAQLPAAAARATEAWSLPVPPETKT